MTISLSKAISITSAPELIAIIGAGGKTSLLFALANALPGRVAATTTTHLAVAQLALAPTICHLSELESLSHQLDQHKFCLLVGQNLPDGRVAGVDLQLPSRLLARTDVNFVVVEADGARLKSIKAPADHEPAIPFGATLVVPVVGIDALGRRIDDVTHRPELVRQLLTIDTQQLTINDIATLLTHPQGGLKGTPPNTRIIPFINKVETESQRLAARKIATLVLQEPRIEQVVIGAVQSGQPVSEVHKRVTAVILAAGSGKRMGTTKQLLPWGDTTVLGQTIRNAKNAPLHDILLVSGHARSQIEAVARSEGVSAIHNPQFAIGEMLSSLQTAVHHLPKNCTAVLVMLADQPTVPPDILKQILHAYWQGKGELIAPVYHGQRGNPVLISRRYFSELLALPPESAPRALLHRHKNALHLLPVSSATIHQDLDHMNDYLRWRP